MSKQFPLCVDYKIYHLIKRALDLDLKHTLFPLCTSEVSEADDEILNQVEVQIRLK